jgi:UDP-glucose 4-epimerase
MAASGASGARVVVLGATGNVGTSLVSALQEDTGVDSIVAVARRPLGTQHSKVEWRQADVRTTDLVPVFQGADAVVHLAWLIQPSHDEPRMRATNVAGSGRIFAAAAAAGVPTLVYASSVGAYAAGPKDRAVDESWPATGIPRSFYSVHKARVEAMLDRFASEHPQVRVVRLRPGLIFKRGAASEIKRYFLGRLVPSLAIRRGALPVLPAPPGLRVQAVHADDVADAYRRAVLSDVRGAFNIAADPVLGADELAGLLGARPVTVPAGLARAAVSLSWQARLQPTPPGWVDLGLGVPIMDVSRARRELGWMPRRSSLEALDELLEGIPQHAHEATPALRV